MADLVLLDEAADVVAAAGALAGTTDSVTVVVDPCRGRPVSVLARDLVTLDHLLGSSLTVALAASSVGGAEGLRNAVALLRALWSNEEVSGTYGTTVLAEAPSRPGPATPGGPRLVWFVADEGSLPDELRAVGLDVVTEDRQDVVDVTTLSGMVRRGRHGRGGE